MLAAASNAVDLLDSPIGPEEVEQYLHAIPQHGIGGEVRHVVPALERVLAVSRSDLDQHALARALRGVEFEEPIPRGGHLGRGRTVFIGAVAVRRRLRQDVGGAPVTGPLHRAVVFAAPDPPDAVEAWLIDGAVLASGFPEDLKQRGFGFGAETAGMNAALAGEHEVDSLENVDAPVEVIALGLAWLSLGLGIDGELAADVQDGLVGLVDTLVEVQRGQGEVSVVPDSLGRVRVGDLGLEDLVSPRVEAIADGGQFGFGQRVRRRGEQQRQQTG